MRKAFVLAIELNNDINSIGKQKSQSEQANGRRLKPTPMTTNDPMTRSNDGEAKYRQANDGEAK
ncbi:MAG: hypothetical protein ACREOI_00935 [bacterium]